MDLSNYDYKKIVKYYDQKKKKVKTYKETAVREAFEESSGFFGNMEDIENLINTKCIHEIEHNKYKTFLVYIPYNNRLIHNFRKQFLYVKKNKPGLYHKKGLYEKDMIKWVPYNKLHVFKKDIRIFYKGIISKLMRTI